MLKAKTGDAADFTLTWDQPVEIAEVVYFGRTAWFMNECFRAYQMYLDDAPAAVAQGEFQILHGPQSVPLGAARTAKKLTIKFLNSHGGMNPGAAEIMVFGRQLTKPQFAQLKRQTGAVDAPAADSVEPAALAELIRRCRPTTARSTPGPPSTCSSWNRSPGSRRARPSSDWPACNARPCCSTSTGCW